MTANLVFINNDKVVTDSLVIAEVFGKEHRNVVRDIENQIKKLIEAGEAEWGTLNFEQTQYQQPQNKNLYIKYNLTEEAFTIVAMSYVTPSAMKMKVRFIEEFKRMREYISEQQKPKSQLEIMQMQIEQMIKQERELQELKEKTAVLEEKQDSIVSILSLNNDDWRNKVNQIINAIAMKLGGMQYYKDIRKESYQLLEQRAGCLLDRRLENRQSKMALRGQSKTTISKINKLDVIAEDKKLISVYITVIKEMAIKYQLDINKYELENGDTV